jgi:hypothetical protein
MGIKVFLVSTIQSLWNNLAAFAQLAALDSVVKGFINFLSMILQNKYKILVRKFQKKKQLLTFPYIMYTAECG